MLETAQKTARFCPRFFSYNNVWDHQSKPEFQYVIHCIRAEQENRLLAHRDSNSKNEWLLDKWIQRRKEAQQKGKNTQKYMQWPSQSTAILFWFSQLVAGECIKKLSKGRRWDSSIDVYGTLFHDVWKASICHSSFRMNKIKKDHNKASVNA